jgi:hypothetical protein
MKIIKTVGVILAFGILLTKIIPGRESILYRQTEVTESVVSIIYFSKESNFPLLIRAANQKIGDISESTINYQPNKASCPRITIKGVKEINEGKIILFNAVVEDLTDQSKLVFNWAVSHGTITEGQGTAKINVDTRGAGEQIVTATLTLGGLESPCPATASSATKVISTQPQSLKFDEFNVGDLAATLSRFNSPSLRPIDRQSGIKFGELLMRLDNFAVGLNNDPGASAYLIIYPSRRLSRYGAGAAKYIQNYLTRSRGVDPSRVVIVTGNEIKRAVIELWVTPPGASPPTPSYVECE